MIAWNCDTLHLELKLGTFQLHTFKKKIIIIVQVN